MNTVLIWLLVSMSSSSHNYGTATVIERFATVEDCEHVRANLPGSSHTARCIQAKVVRPSKLMVKGDDNDVSNSKT